MGKQDGCSRNSKNSFKQPLTSCVPGAVQPLHPSGSAFPDPSILQPWKPPGIAGPGARALKELDLEEGAGGQGWMIRP